MPQSIPLGAAAGPVQSASLKIGDAAPATVVATGDSAKLFDAAAPGEAVGSGAPQPTPVDYSFISGREGGSRAYAYALPADRFPKSGVTIAGGLDLSKHSPDDLKRWGVSDAAIGQLLPYFGLTGKDAASYLAHNEPVFVSAEDASAMNRGALNDTATAIQRHYDAANPPTKFADLHPDVQTAIVSPGYQYGPDLARRAPNFWKDITSGDLNAAVGELRNFHDAYSPRRNLEADRMQRGIGASPVAPTALRAPSQP